jgi:hypothetical protein
MAVMIATIVIIVVTEFVKFGNKFLWSRKNDWDYNKDENARRYIVEKYARHRLPVSRTFCRLFDGCISWPNR